LNNKKNDIKRKESILLKFKDKAYQSLKDIMYAKAMLLSKVHPKAGLLGAQLHFLLGGQRVGQEVPNRVPNPLMLPAGWQVGDLLLADSGQPLLQMPEVREGQVAANKVLSI